MKYIIPLLLMIGAVLGVANGALAKPIMADISDYHVAISSDFTGKKLLLFGARNDPGDIVVVVRGPERNVLVRKKESIFGVWVNTTQMRFAQMPYFYAISSSRPLGALKESALYRNLAIGFEHLEFTSPRLSDHTKREEFRQAFLGIQQEVSLYSIDETPLSFMGATLFKTQINFPDNLPRGKYAVDIYLVEDGHLRGVQTIPVNVSKVGFDALIYEAAHEHSLLYGLLAVLIALVVGWTVSVIFNRIW